MKIGIYPGTFDPITHGHTDIITRSLRVFDQKKATTLVAFFLFPTDVPQYYQCLKILSAAVSVLFNSTSPCRADTKPASNADGAK